MSDPGYYGARGGGRPLSSARDRRRACRYRVGLADGSLGWWEDSSFVDAPCWIIDVSLLGCLVESRPLPSLREQQRVWFRPLCASSSDWTEAIVIAVRRRLFRRHQVRLRFLADLPYESFKLLAFGTGRPRKTADPERPEHEKDHFWR